MSHAQARQQVIDEARRWLGAKWQHNACVRYKAVDCGLILADVFTQCGLIEKPEIDKYPRDWALHRDEERYLAVVERYAHQVETPLSGDIAIWKVGRSFSHGAIVVDWPKIIHAHTCGVILDDGKQVAFAGRPVRFYSVFQEV